MKYLKKYETFQNGYDNDNEEDENENKILTDDEAETLNRLLAEINWDYGFYQSIMDGDDEKSHHLDYYKDNDSLYIKAILGVYLQFTIPETSDDEFLIHSFESEYESLLRDFDKLKSILDLVEEFCRLLPDVITLEEHRIDCGLESGLNEYETLQEFKDAIKTIKDIKEEHNYIFSGKDLGLL